jgi:hypothetical protein
MNPFLRFMKKLSLLPASVVGVAGGPIGNGGAGGTAQLGVQPRDAAGGVAYIGRAGDR